MSRDTRLTLTGATRMRIRNGAAVVALALVAGCNMGLDLTNPNSPTEETALSNVEGVIATSLGMQEQFAGSVLEYVRAPALITDEWGTASKALAADISLYTGESIDASFGVVSQPYYNTYRIARTSDNIIANAPGLGGISPAFQKALVANAKLFKGMALGMAAMHYERLPLGAAVEGGVPVPRMQAFAEVIRLLESARGDLTGVQDADLTGFNSRAVSPGFDLRNTIDAMLARYYLYTNQYDQAIAAATRVDLTKVSLLAYPDPATNPIYNYSVVAGYVAPLKSWAREAEPNDRRVPFWVDTLTAPPTGNPPTLALANFALYGTKNAPFPVYVPGEMLLIRAEALARKGAPADLTAAIALINQLRARASTANTPGAGLGPIPATVDTQAEVLAQIAYERRYELFSQGLRWEDLRRLGGFVGRAPKVAFLPMPQAECNSNPNAGCSKPTP